MIFEGKRASLTFDAPLERRFRWADHRRFQQRTRLALALGTLFFGLYGLVDWWLYPEVGLSLLVIRFGALVPLGLGAIALSRHRHFHRVREPVLFLVVILAGICLATITAISPPPFNYAYVPGLSLVLLFGYIFARIRVSLAATAGWIIVFYFTAVAGLLGELNPIVIVSEVLTFCIINLAGIAGCRSLEELARSDFLKNRRIRAERRRLEESNRLLDLRVRQRTAALTRANEELQREAGEREEIQRQLRYLADHDSLTGVFNRRYVEDVLSRLTSEATAANETVAVLSIDIDEFRRVNDRFGNHAGDLLLKNVASRLQACLRTGDLVARSGGDGFLVVLPRVIDTSLVQRVMSRLLKEIARPFHQSDQEITLTVSVGASLYPQDGKDALTLIQNAESALGMAKREGRNRHQVFTKAIFEQMQSRIRLEGDLRQALTDESLYVHYQPKVRLADRRIIGVEALARWDHPERGAISPSVFVSIAEEAEMIGTLGDLILRKSLSEMAAWNTQHGEIFHLNVNLSATQFSEEGTVFRIAALLEQFGIEPEQLCVEVTESAVMNDISEAQKLLDSLRILGVRISIDDFGTGYSSLAYLSRLPLNEIKIDRSFVANIGYVAGDESIVSSTIRLGHSLGLRVVSEGVETESQVRFLEAEGCDEVQGYLFGRPGPLQDLASVVGEPVGELRSEEANAPAT